MMKIVFLDSDTLGGDISFSPIASLGNLTLYPITSAEQVVERVAGADVVITNKVRIGSEEMDSSDALKLICVAATGVNNIDTEYAAKKGIAVKNVAGYSTESVVQMTFAHILNLVNRMEYFDNAVKSKAYCSSPHFTDMGRAFFELGGKRMGIIGMGNIGRRVAEVAEAFGMEICYYATSGIAHEQRYESVGLDYLLSTCDIVSVHAPLNERTRNMIDADKLAIMKPSAYLINAGRGGIVSESALVDAINGGGLAGAGIDVFETEPLPADSVLYNVSDMERLSLSPHVAWASREARTRLIERIAENITDFYRTE